MLHNNVIKKERERERERERTLVQSAQSEAAFKTRFFSVARHTIDGVRTPLPSFPIQSDTMYYSTAHLCYVRTYMYVNTSRSTFDNDKVRLASRFSYSNTAKSLSNPGMSCGSKEANTTHPRPVFKAA